MILPVTGRDRRGNETEIFEFVSLQLNLVQTFMVPRE